MDYLIGVDLGTTATKAVLFDKKGAMVASAARGYTLFRDSSGQAEEDFDQIFEAVLTTIGQISVNLGRDDKLLAVSFSCQMHSLIAYDDSWMPLTRVLTWADFRAVTYSDQLKSSGRGLDIYRRTGTPVHPMTPLSKLLWLKAEKNEIYARAGHYLDLKGSIFRHLFDVNKIDLSLASGTGLFDIFNLAWDREALGLTGLAVDQLPQIVDPYEIEQGLKPEFAKKMGVPIDTPFVWGAGDGPLSNLGVNAIQSGVAAITIGTSGAIRLVHPEPKTDPKARTFTYAIDRDHWVMGGPVNSGGDIFRWVRDQVFNGDLSFDEITRLAEQVPAGAGGLLFHPYLGGERAPIWEANARGSFFGLNYTHSRDAMARSALEGVVFNLYMVALSLVEVSGGLKMIQATGGFTGSRLWIQILADIFEQPIQVSKNLEAGCLGAVILAQKALGLVGSIEEVERASVSSQIYQPNPKVFESYRRLLPIYINLSRDFLKEYEAIADYQRENRLGSN